MESANPVFNNLFVGTGEKPALNLETIMQIAEDFKNKLATPIFIGIRNGYLENENEVKELGEGFVINSPASIVAKFNKTYLNYE